MDDICTSGHSLDTARAYIEAAGGTAVLFSWLKTINTNFAHMNPTPKLSPFGANGVPAPAYTEFSYRQHIVSQNTPGEIKAALAAYEAWKWP